MRLLINHLTRMHGGHICTAGVDLETRRHVRPVLNNALPLPFDLLARYGGPFEMGWIVDLGRPRPTPDVPHVEDQVFVPARAKPERRAAAHEFWRVLNEIHRTRLCDIFGPSLHEVGRGLWGTDLGQGAASLGVLRPATPPELHMAAGRDGKPRIRLRLSDGEIETDLGVTDVRLFGDDHATPEAGRIRAANQWMADSREVFISVGLTRKYRVAADAPYYHWLQANNLHLSAEPAWALG